MFTILKPYEEIIKKYSKEYNIEENIIKAIIMIESSGDALAFRYEPKYRYFYKPEYFARKNNITLISETILQKCSFGLMQIIGSTARTLGKEDNLLTLINPEENILYGTKYLSILSKQYSKPLDLAAAYNGGSVRLDGNGIYVNINYVEKFKKMYEAINASAFG